MRVRAIVFNIGTVESTIHVRLGLVISGNIRICVFGRSRSEMLMIFSFLLMISHECKLGSIYNIYISSFPSHHKFRHLSKLAKGQNMRDPPCIWIGLMYLDPPCIWIDD